MELHKGGIIHQRHMESARKLGLGARLPKDQFPTPQRAEAYYQEERFLLSAAWSGGRSLPVVGINDL